MLECLKLYAVNVENQHRPLYYTLSDAKFSPRTLAMLKSLRKFDAFSKLIFFHFDDISNSQLEVFQNHNIETILISKFIGESNFLQIANSRNYVEMMWTLPSILAEELLRSHNNAQVTDIVYLDADLYFFSSPVVILSEIPVGKISIVRHNFSERLARAFPNSGTYNVSWVSFPNSKLGLECAETWAAQCKLLCPSIPTILNGKLVYGDQLYLEDWPSNYQGSVHVIESIGAGVAPWNYENYVFSSQLPFTVDGIPVIFFHFSSHQFGFWLARKMGRVYSAVKPIPSGLYRVYEEELAETIFSLGFSKWRSRYESVLVRGLNFARRLFK